LTDGFLQADPKVSHASHKRAWRNALHELFKLNNARPDRDTASPEYRTKQVCSVFAVDFIIT
jgi:hypothetical protein